MGSSLKASPADCASFGDNVKEFIRLLLNQPESEQQRPAEEYLQELFNNAVNANVLSTSQSCLDLCYLVDQLRRSKSTVLQGLAFSNSTCEKLFMFYLEWSERHQQKAMRQVLDLVSTLFSLNPDMPGSTKSKFVVLLQIANVISHKASQSMVKPAFKALEVFVSKRSILPSHILRSFLQVACGGLSFPHDPEPQDFDVLVSSVFHWMRFLDVSPNAGRFLVALFVELRKTYPRPSISCSHTTLWKSWIIHGLSKYPDSLENIKNHILATLFKNDRAGSVEFLRELTRHSDFSELALSDLDTNATLLLAAMEIGKVFGLVEDANLDENLMGKSKKRDQILLPEKAIGNLLSYTSASIRSSALSVLVTSTADTRPFTAETLGFLKQNIGHMHADTDAHFRNNVLSSTRNLLNRLDCAIRYLMDVSRKVDSSSNTSAHSLLEAHLNFKIWYLGFLAEELVPTASYQRHVTALRAIMALPEMSSTYEYHFFHDRDIHLYSSKATKWSRRVNRLVLDLLADPFEEVRSCSALVLRSVSMNPNIDVECKTFLVPGSMIWNDSCEFLSSKGYVLDPGLIYRFIQNTEKAKLKTGRADLADGVARAHELLYILAPSVTEYSGQGYLVNLVSKLEQMIGAAKNDLAYAVRLAPIHGEFASFCLIIDRLSPEILALTKLTEQGIYEQKDRWDVTCQRLITCCQDIWAIVEDVLCNDSPEGGSLSDSPDAVDTKELLSYSFRAIHESSKLMRTIVTKMNLQFADHSPFLDYKQFEEIGNLTFRQLASLRHRGAFSTVSLTFAKCCQQTQTLSPVQGNADLLPKWYQGTLDCIYDQVSTTRRSAGIPALITGILSANDDNISFDSVMKELQRIARIPVNLSHIDETNLPQVHAMNSMKEIYKLSTLRKKSELYIAAGLQLAAESLQSTIWAIRNCGLILLRSLLDRMFGSYESKALTDAGWDGLSIKLSYDKYEALPNLLVKLLDVHTEDEKDIQSVFPALDIVRRAGPPPQYRTRIYDLVSRHLGSTVWLVRDIAARTLCTLMRESWTKSALELSQYCFESTNRCHGVLMTLTYLFERCLSSQLPHESELPSLVSRVHDLRTHSIIQGSRVMQAAYIRLTTAILKLMPTDNQSIQELVLYYRERVGEALEFGSSLETLIFNPEQESASYREAWLLQAILITAMQPKNVAWLDQLVRIAVEGDPETACTVLEFVPTVWSTCSYTQQHGELYAALLLNDLPSQVRCIVCKNLASILDDLSRSGIFNVLTPGLTDQSSLFVESSSSSPALSNAQIRLSGSLMIRKVKTSTDEKQYSEQLIAWGEMLLDAGNANNDFDTRFAAVESLEAFYLIVEEGEIKCSDSFVPSLLAVYDALVDDDEEVRDVAAQIVCKILGGCLIPLAAQQRFFPWLAEAFSHDARLRATTLRRLTGCGAALAIEPVQEQLARAMQEDATLFVEEEPNLFRDDVRETRPWAEILPSARGPHWQHTRELLSAWVLDGLGVMRSLVLARADGPRGWTSHPRVFGICMRVLRTARALGAPDGLRDAASPLDRGHGEAGARQARDRTQAAAETPGAIAAAAWALDRAADGRALHEALREEIGAGVDRTRE